VFSVSGGECVAFLDPIIDSWTEEIAYLKALKLRGKRPSPIYLLSGAAKPAGSAAIRGCTRSRRIGWIEAEMRSAQNIATSIRESSTLAE